MRLCLARRQLGARSECSRSMVYPQDRTGQDRTGHYTTEQVNYQKKDSIG